jgi:hypothetical protein
MFTHTSGMTVFAANETVVRPIKGFALKESFGSADVAEGDKWYYVIFGVEALKTFELGRVSAMTVIDVPGGEPAAKAVRVNSARGVRFVYTQEACGLTIERLAQPVFDKAGDLVELLPTNDINPEATTKGGFLKPEPTLQARLLAGEKFSPAASETAYERGLFALGKVGTLYPDVAPAGGFACAEEKAAFQKQRTQAQLFVLLTNNYFGAEEIQGVRAHIGETELSPVHALEVVAHMKTGGLVFVSTFDPDTRQVQNWTSKGPHLITAIDTWRHAAAAAEKFGAEYVKITLA